MWHSDVKKRVRQIHVHQNGLGNITKTRYQSTDRLKWHRNETRANIPSEILCCFVFFFLLFSLWRCMELICNSRCSCLQWLLSRIVLTSDRTYVGFVWNNMAFGIQNIKSITGLSLPIRTQMLCYQQHFGHCCCYFTKAQSK